MLNFLLSAVSAILLVAIFPRYDLTFLAPLALTPLLLAAAREKDSLRRFLMGETAGIIFWFGLCNWIQFVLAVHGGMGELGGWGTFALFCLAKALHLAVFTWLAGPLMRKWYAIPAVAALWTGIERTHGPFGFAWLTLGNAGIDMAVPVRLAPYTGVYGISFVFVMLSAALALVILKRPRKQLAWLIVLPALYLLPELPAPATGGESAVAVQPNVPMGTPTNAKELKDRLATLSLQAALAPGQPAPSLILWPESPGPLYYYSDAAFRDQISQLARTTKAAVVFSTVAFTPTEQPLNSAIVVSPQGDFVSRYDKMFLVPFGEFVPPLFSFVNRITQESGDFVPGEKVVIPTVNGHKLGAFICYESAFPHLVREFAKGGGEVLINLTNDGYFGKTSARLQHLSLARMRAVENNRWLLRPTNDGYTVSIDPAGRIVDRMEPYQQAATRLSYSYISDQTWYTMHGDWFAWGCLIAALIFVFAAQIPVYKT